MGKAVDYDLTECLQRYFGRFHPFNSNIFHPPVDVVCHILYSLIDAFEYVSVKLLHVAEADSLVCRVGRQFQKQRFLVRKEEIPGIVQMLTIQQIQFSQRCLGIAIQEIDSSAVVALVDIFNQQLLINIIDRILCCLISPLRIVICALG